MGNKPKIKLELTVGDRLLDLVGWVLICAIWIMTIVCYPDLPNIVPVHFNGAGIADGYGTKNNLLVIPAIATFFYIGLTILNKFPHLFNFPCEITEENALWQYTLVTKMMRHVKLALVIVFGIITFNMLRQSTELEVWFLPLTLILLFAPLIYYFIQSRKSL